MATLGATLIPTRAGAILPLSSLAELSEVERPSTINREWGKRLIKVQANVRERDIASFVAEAKEAIAAEGETVRLTVAPFAPLAMLAVDYR